MDLLTLDEAKAYLRIKRVSDHDAELPFLIAAVSEDIRTFTGFDWLQQTLTENRNGNGQAALTALKAGRPGPPITSVTSVKENGVALTVATSYSASADVIVDLTRGTFTRRGGGNSGRWDEGVLNVELVYQCGDVVASIPGDIKLVAREAVAGLFRRIDSKWQGIASRSNGQGSVSVIEELPPLYRGMLERRRRVIVPAV
jgi:hypothetical protein